MTVDEERAWNISNRRINDLIRQLQERDATIKQLKADVDHNVKRALEIAEEKDATIKELQESNEGIKQTNIEAYDRVKQLQDENQRLKEALNKILNP